VIRKIYSLLAFVSLIAVLAGGGLAGYLGLTGKLGGDRLERIAAVLRGEPEAPASQPAVEPAASQPASQPAHKSARSAEELRQQRRDEQFRRAVLERAGRDVAAQKDLLAQAMQELISREESFEAGRKAWKEEQARLRDTNRDEGFEQELKFVAKLAPKAARDHLIKTWNKQKADAVRLISALPPSAGQRILDQLKTPEELAILHELLEQIRNSGAEAPAASSGPGTAAVKAVP
jgi:hypothetical protein